jgi:hypothetical protein
MIQKHHSPAPGVENFASAALSLNVSTVNNVNNVSPIASCEHCMRFSAPIGTLCPDCNERITDPLDETLTSKERTIIDTEREAVSLEGCRML